MVLAFDMTLPQRTDLMEALTLGLSERMAAAFAGIPIAALSQYSGPDTELRIAIDQAKARGCRDHAYQVTYGTPEKAKVAIAFLKSHDREAWNEPANHTLEAGDTLARLLNPEAFAGGAPTA